MTKHEQRMLEAQWSLSEALEWAVGEHELSGRWPSRRFRVEGGAGGNTGLLAMQAAKNAHAQFGGELVEVIPELKNLRRDMLSADLLDATTPPLV